MLHRLILSTLLILAACQRPPADASLADGLFTPEEVRQLRKMVRTSPEPVSDPTNPVHDDPRARLLGQAFFFDTGLSADGRVSCARCHAPDHGFAMDAPQGLGISVTERNPPTLLNVAYQQWFNWDGRADSIWMQAMGPLEAPNEHGTTRVLVARHLLATPSLKQRYEDLFGTLPSELQDEDRFPAIARPDPERPDSPHHQAWLAMPQADRDLIDAIFLNVVRSLGAYQAQLVSVNSPFDRYASRVVNNEDPSDARLSESALRGLKLFLGKGQCVVCHNGPMLSDMAFHNIGLAKRSFPKQIDEGRWSGVPHLKSSEYNTIGKWSAAPDGERAQRTKYLMRTPEDHSQFRTPTLRNISQTRPYMHTGHLFELEDVVRFYSELPETPPTGHREDFLAPSHLNEQEIQDLVAFLKTLDGEPIARHLLGPPASK